MFFSSIYNSHIFVVRIAGSGNEINIYCRETAVQSLNKSFQSVGESLVRLKTVC